MATSRYAAQRESKRPLADINADISNGIESYLAATSPAAARSRKKGKKKTIEDNREFFLRRLRPDRDKIHRVICEKLKYCERRNSKTVEFILNFSEAIVTAKIALLTQFPVAPVKLSAFLLRAKVLDPFCKCDKAINILAKRK